MLPKKLKYLQWFFELALLVCFAAISSGLTDRRARALGRFLGRLAFYLDFRDRMFGFENLDIVLGGKALSSDRKKAILKRLFMNVGVGACEFFRIPSLRPSAYGRTFRAKNPQAVLKALKFGKGVLIVSAHLGNWEYLAALTGQLGFDVATVIKRQHNPWSDRYLKKFRERHAKVKCYYNEKAVERYIGQHLKKNGILALLADQAYRTRPVFAPFFGRTCACAPGPAMLHIWYGAPVVFAFCPRQPDGKYLAVFDGPYFFETTGRTDRDLLEVTSAIHRKFEKMILEYPDQWFSLLTPRWR